MTNLEANKKRIRDGMALCIIAHLFRHGELCSHKKCLNCEFNGNVDECIKEVLAEHKEPIKLKQWEYDLLTIFENHTVNDKLTLDSAIIIAPMLRAGYFKGVPNTSMTIQEILENCEVVE